MGDILPFKKASSTRRKNRPKTAANALCRNGHHKWLLDKTKQFDVKQGRLLTRYRCCHCGKERVEAL
ncbi:MAG: hypothetical protein ACK5ME_05700 [Parahaliea sp.]